jgi:23S rRNA pseudouridine955/2504/2580 synthase
VVDAKGKEALSHFQPIKNFDGIDASLVEVLIETGRMHQIRVHAQYAGHPLTKPNATIINKKNKINADFG